MVDRLFEKLDLLPGGKTYILAGVAAVLFWGHAVGLIPTDVYDTLLPWIQGLMGPTVLLKMMRP